MDALDQQKFNDHDLLVSLNTRVADLISLINRLDGQTSRDIGGLQTGKVGVDTFSTHSANDNKEHQNFEKSIAQLWEKSDFHSRMIWITLGVFGALQVIVPFLMQYYFKV